MNKVEKILFKLIDKEITNVDTYRNSGSLWLIFTDEKKWVIEFTDSGVLWFNYSFFNKIFSLIGLSNKKEEYIKKWFEERFLFKPKVEDTTYRRFVMVDVEDTIQNGVIYTDASSLIQYLKVKDTIQNGVRHTTDCRSLNLVCVEDTIQNGVIYTSLNPLESMSEVEDTIQNGVIYTRHQDSKMLRCVEDTIQNGVKRTLRGSNDIPKKVEYTIQNGAKDTFTRMYSPRIVEDTIQNGVKHCEYGDWLDGDERIDKIVENGLKV